MQRYWIKPAEELIWVPFPLEFCELGQLPWLIPDFRSLITMSEVYMHCEIFESTSVVKLSTSCLHKGIDCAIQLWVIVRALELPMIVIVRKGSLM